MSYICIESGENNRYPVVFITENLNRCLEWLGDRPAQIIGVEHHKRARHAYHMTSIDLRQLHSNQEIVHFVHTHTQEEINHACVC